MSLVDVSALAAAIFFAIYGVATAVECGVAINLLIDPKLTSRRFFTPLWEVTNVFLVFGFTAVAMLFNNALQQLSSALLSTIMIGLVALIARACIVLTIFYWRPDKLPKWLAWAFALSCFTIPLSFTAAGTYLLTGQMFWQSFTGWTIMASSLLGILAIGLVAMNPQRKKTLWPNELVFTAWLIVLGSVLPLSARLAMPQTQKTPLITLSLLTIVGLAITMRAINNPKIRLWRYGAVVAFSAPLLLAWANRPYLIAGKITLDQAFSAASYAKAFVVGTAIILPLVLLGFYLFWKLLKAPE